MWQFFFFFLFCYYFFEWVSNWMSEWVSCVAPTIVSSGSPHRVWESESQREQSGLAAQESVCVCVRQYTCLHQYTHARSTHLLSRTHDMHSTFALLLLCSAAAPIEIVACAAVELSVQFEQRYRAVPLSSFSASKTFSLLKCPKAAATICKILLPAAAAAAVVVAANAQWALRAAAATTKVYDKALKF